MGRQSGQIFGDRDLTNDVIANVTDSALHVKLVGNDGTSPVVVDPDTGYLIVSDHDLYAIHQGRHWHFSAVDQTVAANGVMEILLRIPANFEAHVHIGGTVGFNALGEMFEDPTSSSPGTLQTVPNRNRSSVTTPEMDCYLSPTLLTDGTQLMQIFMPGGVGKQAAGGTGDSNAEWIMTEGDYLLRITNLTNTANVTAGIDIEWHESAV